MGASANLEINYTEFGAIVGETRVKIKYTLLSFFVHYLLLTRTNRGILLCKKMTFFSHMGAKLIQHRKIAEERCLFDKKKANVCKIVSIFTKMTNSGNQGICFEYFYYLIITINYYFDICPCSLFDISLALSLTLLCF